MANSSWRCKDSGPAPTAMSTGRHRAQASWSMWVHFAPLRQVDLARVPRTYSVRPAQCARTAPRVHLIIWTASSRASPSQGGARITSAKSAANQTVRGGFLPEYIGGGSGSGVGEDNGDRAGDNSR